MLNWRGVFRNFLELRNIKFDSDWIFEMSMRFRFRQYIVRMGFEKLMSELQGRTAPNSPIKNFHMKTFKASRS